jgi:hypothetical protein
MAYLKQWFKKRREFLNSLKDKPCTDCGVKYPPYVMQWDHISNDKKYTISSIASASMEKILAEIAKCELVCANCHAIRSYERLLDGEAESVAP